MTTNRNRSAQRGYPHQSLQQYGCTRLLIPTPFPIGPTNVYLLQGDIPTLIDTGTMWPVGQEALANALAREGLAPQDIGRVLITHGHSDHAGLASWLQEQGAEIFIHPAEAQKLSGIDMFALREKFLRQTGVPEEMIVSFRKVGDIRYYGCLKDYQPLSDGDEFPCGRFTLSVVATPGHCHGHLAFYEAEKKILFGGDTLLENVSPNPMPELHMGERTPSLTEFLKTLQRLEGLPARTVLPGHGEPFQNIAERVAQVRQEHQVRLQTVLTLLADGITAYQLALKLYGQVRGWNVYLAMAETCAHLDFLMEIKLVQVTENNTGGKVYLPVAGQMPGNLKLHNNST
ncbi:MBL fold metallo-hydrolase [Dethiobacter alkaliphilus]|uniref:MBL fold metallo-hydrolase n=1 Tax=Dethiobacter alkaliphilus TaxID=427926 RepID=UPI002227FFF2|nr:MBL fold metallo-hydrolase [Dethiobacter alkaliphilus]MCW3490353.1 MBL fold metallo-hydrolase [Dethiobacter alkaliphilus]